MSRRQQIQALADLNLALHDAHARLVATDATLENLATMLGEGSESACVLAGYRLALAELEGVFAAAFAYTAQDGANADG